MAAPIPIGVEGTTAWLQAAAAAFGIRPRVAMKSRRRRANARRPRWPANAKRWLARRIFFFPDSQLELPIARFLSRELGMQLTEVGTPFLHREHMAQELAWLPAGTTLSEGQDVDRQLDRCRALRPDHHRLRPGPGQPAGGRRPDHQVGHRTGLHAHPRLRAGRRPGRAVCPPAAPPCAAGRLSPDADHAAHPLDLRRPAPRGRHARGHGHARRALRAARAAGRHLRRSAVHDDRAPQRAPAGHLHHLPGARPGWRHGRALQDRRPRGLRTLQAQGPAGRARPAPPS
jgi:hypothetical protein